MSTRLVILVFVMAVPCFGQSRMDEPRPIDVVDTVFIEELTWMEVRDAIRGGKTTVVVASGGIEPRRTRF